MKYRVFPLLVTALCACFVLAASAFAAVPGVRPDARGVYTVEATDIDASSVVVLVTGGLAEEGEKPVVSKENVLWFNVVPVTDGRLSFSFVPQRYTDGTVFLGAPGFEKPLVVCHVLADGIKDAAEIAVSLDTASVTASGDDEVSIGYTVTVRDSFGNLRDLPENAVVSLDHTDGGRVRVVPDENRVYVGGFAAAGDYTLSVTVGDVTGKATFAVLHDPTPVSVTHSVAYFGEDTDYTAYFIFATRSVDGLVYEPETLPFTVKVLDRYGDELASGADVTYRVYTDDVAGNEIPFASGVTTFDFGAPREPATDEVDTYDILLRAAGKPSVFTTVKLFVIGSTEYEGKAQTLFSRLSEAQALLDEVEAGEIVVASSGTDVSASKRWIRESYVTNLRQAVDEAVALLRRVVEAPEDSPVPDRELEEAADNLRSATASFNRALSAGLYSRITSLGFDETHVYLPVGTRRSVPANVTPARPSERPVYTVADPSVASVASDGTVTASRTPGETTVTVSDIHETLSASYTLTVYIPVTRITPVSETLTLCVGETRENPFAFAPEDNGDALTYTSSETRTVTVTRDGTLLGMATGSATVSVKTRSGLTASVTVNVIKPSVSADHAVARRDETFTLPLTVDGVPDGASLTVSLAFDKTALRFMSAEGSESAGETADGATVTFAPGKTNGTFSLTFETLSEAPFGEVPVTVSATVRAASGTVLQTDTAPGTVRIAEALYGDVNDDGKVDRDDLDALAGYFAGFDEPVHTENADVNADGRLTAADLLRLARYFAGDPVLLGR